MGNSNMELDIRLWKVERMLENYKSTIEPKSWEFIGQHWYDTSTEVLNVWNGREFTPAYWNSIISTIEWYETRISQNEYAIAFEVVNKDEVLSAINLSSEWVRILWSRIQLDWDVVVSWTFTLDQINDGSTYKRTTANEKTWAARWYNALNASYRYQNWLLNSELSTWSNPTNWVIIDSWGIRWYTAAAKTFEIDTWGNAYFKWTISAESWYINWDLIMNATWYIQSSNYSWSNWWKISTAGLYMWIDSELYMRPGSWIYLWYWWAWAKVSLVDWSITFLYSSTATDVTLYSDYGWELLVNNNFEPTVNTSYDLWSSSYAWLRVYAAWYNFSSTWAYLSVWGSAWNYRPIFYNGSWSYSCLYVTSSSSVIWTVDKKLKVNVAWTEYWLHAETA